MRRLKSAQRSFAIAMSRLGTLPVILRERRWAGRTVDVYDPATATWTAVQSMGGARAVELFSTVALGDQLAALAYLRTLGAHPTVVITPTRASAAS